jgi:integrase
MASTRLTAVAVEKLSSPATVRKDIYDKDSPGLVLRVSPSGAKSWSFTYRANGKQRRLSLGAYPGVSLKLARERAQDARGAVQRGEDPVEDKKAEKRDKAVNNFKSCVTNYVAQYAKPKLRTWKETERILTKLAVPVWGDRAVRDLRRRDVVELLEAVATKTPVQSNRLRANLSRMFRWLVEREILEVSPIVGVSPRTKVTPRSRILTDDELVALWKATIKMGGTFGAAIRFLMTTGVRRDEASFLKWDELQDKEWAAMPASRMKAGRDFRAPLSSAAQAIIEGQPRIEKCEYVFTTNGKSPISGWSKAKKQIDKLMAVEAGKPVPDWRPHDLRRTLASGLARLGYRSEVIKRVLGHMPSNTDVTASFYVWHNFDAESQKAVQHWADHLAALITPTVTNPAEVSQQTASA